MPIRALRLERWTGTPMVITEAGQQLSVTGFEYALAPVVRELLNDVDLSADHELRLLRDPLDDYQRTPAGLETNGHDQARMPFDGAAFAASHGETLNPALRDATWIELHSGGLMVGGLPDTAIHSAPKGNGSCSMRWERRSRARSRSTRHCNLDSV